MLLNKEDIIEKVKSLNLPHNSYVVFGSGPLAAAGIRKTQDIDLFVNPRIFEMLLHRGWELNDDETLTRDEFEVGDSWVFGTYRPRLEDLLATADVIKGVPFVNLHEVRKWKQQMSRPKDHHDIEMIDDYLAHHGWS
jgi:hypothetical protein